MPQSIPLWGVVTPEGEPIVHTLDYTQYGASYRYGAVSYVPSEMRESFWRDQQARGYRVQKFTLTQEHAHG